jgi:CheY-like chemotaxis protein/class 3 adenylate cyclase
MRESFGTMVKNNTGLSDSTDNVKVSNASEISFNNNSENYCVSIVDIVGSTSLVSTIRSSEKVRKFYSIFINVMADEIKKYNGRIVKTMGDGIISYFPKTANSTDKTAFEDVIECCYAQVAASPKINSKLQMEKLPTIGYRISADYGRMEIARSATSSFEDLYGPTINFCSKINPEASPNGIVIGNDLYRVIRSFPDFPKFWHFEELQGSKFQAGKYSYPIYALYKKSTPAFMTVINSLSQYPNQVKGNVVKTRRNISQNPTTTTILLIDDEEDDLFTLEKFLTSEGYAVKSFSDSHEALQHFTKTSDVYDLIITDIRMPKINGVELYHKLKAIRGDIKILFASCVELAEEILSVMPGVNHNQLIKKPIERREFIEIVDKSIHVSY